MVENSKIGEFIKRNERILIGWQHISCPVYVLNISYKSKNSDPFYPLDRAILQYLDSCSDNANIPYLASLLGMETGLIRSRIQVFIKDNVLNIEEVGSLQGTKCTELRTKYVLTEKARNKYLDFESSDRPDVTVSCSVMVDGKTLEFLPDVIYEGGGYRHGYNKTTNLHRVIMDEKDEVFKEVTERLNRLSEDKKELYGIEHFGRDFSINSYEAKNLYEVQLLFSCDKQGRLHKELFYKGNLVSMPALKEGIGKYLFYLDAGQSISIKSNMGYANGKEEEYANKSTNFRPEYIKRYIQERYRIENRDIKETDFVYTPECSLEYPYPLVINSTVELLHKAKNARLLIEDTAKGMIPVCVDNGGGGIYIKFGKEDEFLRLIEIDAAIIEWKKTHGNEIDYDFVQAKLSDISLLQWRKCFITLKRYDELEDIDRKMYIKN